MNRFIPLTTVGFLLGILTRPAWAEETQPPFQADFASVDGSVWSAGWESLGAEWTYFMQVSTDLVSWAYLPDMKSGAGIHTGSGENTNVPKFFFRLKYTDLDPDNLSGDGIPALFKITPLGLDPFVKATADASGNGLPDAWEIFHFGAVNIALPDAVPQPDGLTNKEKAELGLDPDVDYSTAEAGSFGYDYDDAGRLTEVTGEIGDAAFTPDAAGNLTNAQ